METIAKIKLCQIIIRDSHNPKEVSIAKFLLIGILNKLFKLNTKK